MWIRTVEKIGYGFINLDSGNYIKVIPQYGNNAQLGGWTITISAGGNEAILAEGIPVSDLQSRVDAIIQVIHPLSWINEPTGEPGGDSRTSRRRLKQPL